MKTLFMTTTMMQANCGSTNDQLNSILPMLLMDKEGDNSNMKTMLLMQTMSEVRIWSETARRLIRENSKSFFRVIPA